MRFLPSRPAGRIKKRRRPAHNSWTNLRRFFGLWMGCGHRCRNAICGRTPTKPGVSKGGLCLPFGTQPCLQGIQSPHMQAETTILSIYYLSNIFDRNRYCSVRIIYKFYVFRIIKKIRGYCYFNSCISFNFMLFAFPNGIGSFDGNRYRDTLLMDLLYKFFGKFIRFRKNHMAQFNCI